LSIICNKWRGSNERRRNKYVVMEGKKYN